MDDPASYYISIVITLLALFGLSVFFALCETSFSSLNKIKLKNMAAKNKRARLALQLLGAYDKLLSSVLIGNTIVNVVTSAIATALFIRLFGPRGVSIASVVVTLAILILGEISPKTLAKEMPELTATRVAPLARFFTVIFAPLNFLTSQLGKIIVKIFPANTNKSVTEDEFLTYVEEVRQEGGINLDEERMIRQVIEFDEITAAEIVTPRIDLAAVGENAAPQEIDRVFAETGFSRLPVYRENIDNITGVLLLKDFHHEVLNKGRQPAELVKPVVFITKTMKLPRLLRTLQEKQAHMAIVVDEFGGTVGIVTIEDIVEELVGEIWDEHEEVVEEFRQNGDGSVTVLGSAKLQDMFEFIGIKEDAAIPGTTVSNWILETKGGLPRAGEQFTLENVTLRVTRVQRHRVTEVTVFSA